MIRAFLRWLREEWRLARLDDWADEPRPGTLADPRCAEMVKRQRSYGLSLRKQGESLLRPIVDGAPRGYGKSYRPVLTIAAPAREEKPPKAGKVFPIHRRTK